MSALLPDLLYTMREIIEEATSVPLSAGKCFIDREKALHIIMEAIECMPEQIHVARGVADRKDQIITEAQSTAEKIIEKAKKEALIIVSDQSIVKESEQQAREIYITSQTKSAEVKKLTTDFCEERLLRAEESLAVILEEVKSTRKRFNGGK